ncbi:MAG TPA: hypothetical protein VKZ88_02050, partial [Fibrobacteria bacterium]|nr:hypothetical protein [Fibrobacteria bacterium]
FRSEACAHQGFAWGARAVGLQFHPEITVDAVDAWIAVAESGGDLRPGPYVQTAAAMKKAAGAGAGLVADNNRALEKLFTVLTQGLRV